MILILSSRWGTKPAADGRFSSGTEEEFYLAQDCIAREDSPMTDILVLFKGVPEDQLSDPGDQLRRVIEFKQRLEESRTLLYKTFDDLEGLCREVGNRVLAWARGQGRRAPRPKEGRPLVPPDSTTNSSEHVEPAGAPALAAAEEYEAKGLMTQAEAAYARAIVDSDAASLEKYARFLRRTGRRTARLRRPPPRPAPPRARRSGRAMVTAAQPRRAPSSTPRPAAGTPGRRGPPADAARRGTVSCVATHRQVTGSMANTSRLWVSCSPRSQPTTGSAGCGQCSTVAAGWTSARCCSSGHRMDPPWRSTRTSRSPPYPAARRMGRRPTPGCPACRRTRPVTCCARCPPAAPDPTRTARPPNRPSTTRLQMAPAAASGPRRPPSQPNRPRRRRPARSGCRCSACRWCRPAAGR